ncbi:MAG: PKD domain-containing protein, partial [Nanoarchaeota archaeon]|nr:PKD domain-containing protein [Nanoarchaeota archaeon]
MCEGSETNFNCQSDCLSGLKCPDTFCQPQNNENCNTCFQDCGKCDGASCTLQSECQTGHYCSCGTCSSTPAPACCSSADCNDGDPNTDNICDVTGQCIFPQYCPGANDHWSGTACVCDQTYYKNCDGITSNGCEVDTRSDFNNCGSCNNPCSTGQTCQNSQCTSNCIPTTEVCDGIDNDCDTQIDEGVKNACGSCGPVPTEVCDNIDNDCDGSIDETFTNKGQTCTVGTGACQRTGTYICRADYTGTVCSVTAGTPTSETCNGIDDNCDGLIDNGITCSCNEAVQSSRTVTCGTGACQRTITQTCVSGQWSPSTCTPLPAPQTFETSCSDSIDNDCDGSADCQDSNCAPSPCTTPSARQCSGTASYQICQLIGTCYSWATTACPSGQSCYNGYCYDFSSDEANCGSGGNACESGETCCSGACADLSSSATNCGSCDNNCNTKPYVVSASCSAGQCVISEDSCASGHYDINKEWNDGCEYECTIDSSGITNNKESLCNDGQDNDCDKLTDCQDSDCLGNLLCLCTSEKTYPCGEFGVCSTAQQVCVNGRLPGCDLSKIPGYESTEQTCDGLDNDCNSVTDQGTGWSCDLDDDSWCDSSRPVSGKPPICLNGTGDCNDNNKSIHPKAVEKCDGIDSNCNNILDHDEFVDNKNLCTCNFIKEAIGLVGAGIQKPADNAKSRVGETVPFSAKQSAQVDAYNWDFGDDTSGTGASTTHAYSSIGTYTASLIVWYEGCTSTYSVKLNITGCESDDHCTPLTQYCKDGVCIQKDPVQQNQTIINIVSPKPILYSNKTVPLQVTTTPSGIPCSYSLDNSASFTPIQPTTNSVTANDGDHTLRVKCSEAITSVQFKVFTSGDDDDTTIFDDLKGKGSGESIFDSFKDKSIEQKLSRQDAEIFMISILDEFDFTITRIAERIGQSSILMFNIKNSMPLKINDFSVTLKIPKDIAK